MIIMHSKLSSKLMFENFHLAEWIEKNSELRGGNSQKAAVHLSCLVS